MNQPLSVYELIANASLLVQGVMGLLVIASVVSWMMILQRWSLLRRARYEIDSFEDHFLVRDRFAKSLPRIVGRRAAERH